MDKSGSSHVAKALDGVQGAGRQELARGFRLRQWRVQPAFCVVTDGVHSEQLEPKVMGVLLCLAQHAPEVVTHDQFIREVWEGRAVSDEVLSRSISLLRGHLGDDAHEPRFIRTVLRIGYALIAPVERLDASLDAESQVADSQPQPTATSRPADVRRTLRGLVPHRAALLAAVAVVVALLAAISWFAWRDHEPPRDSPAATTALIRLAVLPLANLSRDPEKEYFADGLTDELIGSLSRSSGLTVVARTSAFRFKNRSEDVREIGRMLGATHVVEGSVRSDGQRLRIGVQLVNASTGYELWAETYDGDLTDLFAVQADIASAIVQSLERRLPAGFASDLAPPTRDLGAYQLYLRGQQQLNRRGEASIRRSIELFRQALAVDPEFARAHVALAYAYLLLPSYTSVDADLMSAQAEAALGEAARWTGTSPDALGVRAMLEFTRRQWLTAEEAFRKALASNPSDTELRLRYSLLLGAVGKPDAALAEAQRALANDPLSPILNHRLAVTCLWTNQDARAAEHLATARELGLSASAGREADLLLLVRARKFEELTRALSALQESRGQSDEWVPEVVAAIKDPGSTIDIARRIERAVESSHMDALLQVGALILTGQSTHVLQALLARPRVSPSELELLFVREARELRQQPDFGRLIVKLGVDEYWNHYGWPPGCARAANGIRCL